MSENNENQLATDVLKGAEEIAAFLGEDVRSVFYQIANGKIPHYRVGQAIRARRSTLLAWISGQEVKQVAA